MKSSFSSKRLKNGDVDDFAFRTALIDTFVNRIYLYGGDDARAPEPKFTATQAIRRLTAP